MTCVKNLLCVAIFPIFLSCIWDRDTLADEAAGNEKPVRAMLGWFDRNPNKYYELRLARCLKELETEPKLELYDDASAALDRLGRSEDAIILMRKKRKLLDSLPDSDQKKEHEYRYLANLGTFHAHAWFRLGERQRNEDFTHLDKAEQLIREAIKLNPDAHFGREKFQLAAIMWLNPKNKEQVEKVIAAGETPTLLTFVDGGYENEEAVEGLTGLIRLGGAWKSVDVFAALAQLYGEMEHSSLAYLAQLRISELESNGFYSAHYSAAVREQASDVGSVQLEKTKPLEQWYGHVRAASNRRHSQRMDITMERLNLGQHPDTHKDFWSGWEEPEFPQLHYSLDYDEFPSNARIVLVWGCSAVGVIALVYLLLQLRKKMSQ